MLRTITATVAAVTLLTILVPTTTMAQSFSQQTYQSAKITIYNIPNGHDGWVVPTTAQCPAGSGIGYETGPADVSHCDLQTISGSDLGNITSQSVVIAQQVNGNGLMATTPTNYIGYGIVSGCTVWNVFSSGFNAYCPATTSSTSLRVLVVTPT